MKELTPKQVARALGVSESSLKRWCDQGLIASHKTAGGHRRLTLDAVSEYLRSSQRTLEHPELLGLPATVGKGPRVLCRARAALFEALVAGDDRTAWQIVVDLHLAGHRISVICDEVLSPVFVEVGQKWDCEEIDIYQERRGCEICVRLLHDLGALVPEPPPEAPVAIGGAVGCDPYILPTTTVEYVLKQNGWNGRSLGARLPFASMEAAVHDVRPALFWMSVSYLEDEAAFVRDYNAFYASVGDLTAVVVGGRALTETLRNQMRYAVYCDRLQHLEEFLRTYKPKAR